MRDINHKAIIKRKKQNLGSKKIPEITIHEMKHAVGKIKRHNAAGNELYYQLATLY